MIPQIHDALCRQTENLILIGMPGCGKSTIGQLLAQSTGKEFVDADAEIVKLAGISIPEIFSIHGEAEFRRLETRVLEDLGKRSGMIIATGGGCVTREENYPLLHQNGRIIWLQRELEKLPSEGRPLSKAGNLAAMYAVRRPLYEAFSDLTISNDASAEETAQAILAALKTEV